MDAFLDIAFLVVHTALTVFNLTGWMWEKTRRVHLAMMGLTLLSWFGLGVFYGWGYCPCTDWHWEVKRRLGETDLPASYVKYYLDLATGISWDAAFVNAGVLALGLAAFAASVYVNLVAERRRRDEQ
ncbi:MAG: DUF2784 domain-containing protein [Rhodothermales bacterium]